MNCMYCDRSHKHNDLLSLHHNNCNSRFKLLECSHCHEKYKELHKHLIICDKREFLWPSLHKSNQCPFCHAVISINLKKHLTLCDKNPENDKLRCYYCLKMCKRDSNHITFCTKNPNKIGLQEETFSDEEIVFLNTPSVVQNNSNVNINNSNSVRNNSNANINNSSSNNYFTSLLSKPRNLRNNSDSDNNSNSDNNYIKPVNKSHLINKNIPKDPLSKGKGLILLMEKILCSVIEKLEENWENIDLIEKLKGTDEEKIAQIIEYFKYTDMDELIQQMDLECPVCYQFTENKAKPCLHRLCVRCFYRLKQNNMYSCPICREEIYG